MATLGEIYNWFMTTKRPTQEQFWASWGSFWLKDETIPQSAVSNLATTLNSKAEKVQFDAHQTAADAHQGLFDLKQSIDEKGEANGYVPLTEFVKIAAIYLNIVNDLETGGSTALASAETVKSLKEQIDAINLILTSDDVNLDTVQELVDAIKEVETSLQTILVNDLTTGGTTKALTAEMGKSLKALIDALAVAKFDMANVSNDIEADKTSTSKVPSVKQVYEFASGAKVPLAAFLDVVNGNDATAKLESSVKSFKTMAALISALPVTIGETYTIYMTGGTIPITRKMPIRNLTFLAYTDATLDFTTCKDDDGLTDSLEVLRNGTTPSTWTFLNNNISVVCNYVGRKAFIYNDETSTRKTVTIKGFLKVLDWKSTSNPNAITPCFGVGADTDVTIGTFHDSTQARGNIGFLNGFSNIVINNYIVKSKNYFNHNYQFYGKADVYIKTITETGVIAGNVLNIIVRVLKLNTVTYTGTISPICDVIAFDNTIFSSGVSLNITSVKKLTGTLISDTYCTTSWYIGSIQIFDNFNGKLNNLLAGGPGYKFINCNLQINTSLILKYSAAPTEDLLFFEGINTITQVDKTKSLAEMYSISPPTNKNVNVHIKGSLSTNMESLGWNCKAVYESETFKEKKKEVIVRSKKDLVGRVLDPLITYVIDGQLTLLTGEYIEIPAAGLTITGYGFDVSQINKNVAGQSIFTSPVGGSGNLVTKDMQYTSGLGSVFNIQDSDGNHAIEMNDVNFIGCAFIGKLKGYRQFTGTTCGIYSCNDGIQISGNWSGFKLTNSNIINFMAGGTLIKKDVDTLFSNRLYLDINFSCQAGAILSDMVESNFVSNGLFQINNSVATYAGSRDADTNTSLLIPNMSYNDPKSRFTNNLGLIETAALFQDIKSPDGNVWRLSVDNAGAVTATDI